MNEDVGEKWVYYCNRSERQHVYAGTGRPLVNPCAPFTIRDLYTQKNPANGESTPENCHGSVMPLLRFEDCGPRGLATRPVWESLVPVHHPHRPCGLACP